MRTAVLVLIVFLVWLSYAIIHWLIQQAGGHTVSDYATFLSCLFALPLGVGLVWLVEMQLKRVWHSGNSVSLDSNRILLRTKEGAQVQFQLNGDLAVTLWYFTLGKYPRVGNERRVKKQWYCLACQLQQDEERLVVYGFFPPKELADLIESADFVKSETSDNFAPQAEFHEIKPDDLYSNKRGLSRMPVRPDIPLEVLRGKDGRYWLAERRRWNEGFELTVQDFKTFMSFIQQAEEE